MNENDKSISELLEDYEKNISSSDKPTTILKVIDIDDENLSTQDIINNNFSVIEEVFKENKGFEGLISIEIFEKQLVIIKK